MKTRDLIIAGVFAAIFGAVFEIWNPLREIINDKSANNFYRFLNIQISLWVVFASIIIFVLVYLLSRKLLHSTKERNQERKERKFIEDNKYISINGDISAKTKISFGEDSELYLEDITPYCGKHSIKLQMPWGNYGRYECPSCDNSVLGKEWQNEVKSIVFSNLQDKWSKINR